jgi:FKBP-type peptidyl-prolyl cis-trans isomerase SlyD
MDMVADGNVVKLHYTLTVEGKVVDNTREREPFAFQAGSNQVIPGFEKALMGMKVGEKKSFQVSPDEGYGQEDPEGIDEIFLENLPPDLEPEVGMTLYATGEQGQPISGRITEVRQDSVVININHPFAGKTLDYDVEIVEIQKDK